jgi:hypothetical protein
VSAGADQQDVRVDDGFEYLGNGPAVTGDGPGWSMRADLYARCTRCGEMMSLSPDAYAQCRCGALHKDPDAGRFGSSLGDAAIAIYRRRRSNPA